MSFKVTNTLLFSFLACVSQLVLEVILFIPILPIRQKLKNVDISLS